MGVRGDWREREGEKRVVECQGERGIWKRDWWKGEREYGREGETGRREESERGRG